jgi:hypothetical protein
VRVFFCSNIIYIPVKAMIAICSYCAAASARCLLVSSGGNVRWGSLAAPSYGAKARVCTGANHAHVVLYSCRVSRHRVIQRSRPPTLFMSRTSLGTVQEPLTRTDTPDPDGRRRKKVRWNSDSMVEGDKQDDSEENTYECKVRSSCPFMSTSCHLTPTRRRLPRRFV